MSGVDESVSQWIDGLRAGDEAAAAKLWQRYYRRLVGLACKKLGTAPRRAADEEDVVLSAFQSFCQRARKNLFPDLHDRNDLWHLIVRITAGSTAPDRPPMPGVRGCLEVWRRSGHQAALAGCPRSGAGHAFAGASADRHSIPPGARPGAEDVYKTLFQSLRTLYTNIGSDRSPDEVLRRVGEGGELAPAKANAE
jgi:hypothetical protein